jgi:chemotaxis protein MotB
MTLGWAGSLGLFLIVGCVSSGRYESAIKDAERARSEAVRLALEARQEQNSLKSQLDQCGQQQKDAASALEDRERQLSESRIQGHNLQTRLDEATAIDDRLRDELQRLGKNVSQLMTDRGAMSHALDDAKTRLEELRKAQAATEARAALFRELLTKLKKLTDAGQLRIVVRDGRMVLQLPGDVLFDSGQTVIKSDGQRALEQLATALKGLAGRRFQVAGHTDNVPIDSGRFASNWELSVARALSVVHLLVAHGVAPEALSAAGYGEFNPIAGNDTPESRAKNRRIEISLVPDLEEFVNLPSVQ